VIASSLLDLTAAALHKDPELSGFDGRVSDSGEGRWTVAEAIERSISAPVITAALFARFASRDDERFAARIVAALRNQFGGHKFFEESAAADVQRDEERAQGDESPPQNDP
jgi:6-phosphogluconate dehydrogenase